MEKMNQMMMILTMICGVYLRKWEFMWPKDPEFFAKSREFSKLSDH